MLSKIYNLYIQAKESLFYIPALVCLIYALACIGLYVLESTYMKDQLDFAFLYNGNLDQANDIIKTLLSAMITMTTLVISVTMVVLSLSASQLGPRLMKTFMRDRVTKIFIGMFFGSIAACFVLLGLIQSIAIETDLPNLTTSMVFIMCFSNLFILLAYVQHVAKLGIADNAVTKVYNDLFAAIERLKAPDEESHTDEKTADLPKNFSSQAVEIINETNGYIQTIDYERLKELAQEHDLVIKIEVKAGDFMVHGVVLAQAAPKKALTPEVQKVLVDCVVFGPRRTSTQDIEYSIRHLVEVGLRALSPGINDNFTALVVIDKLSAALGLLFNKGLASRHVYDEQGRLRVHGTHYNEGQIIHDAFAQIRCAGQEKPDILTRMIQRLKILKSLSETKEQKDALDFELKCIADHIDAHFKGTQEGERLTYHLKKSL